MTNGSSALQAAAIERLADVGGLTGVYPGVPLQASIPFAIAECTSESDWGHKSGKGCEVRLAVSLKDMGERPTRLQALMAAAQSALEQSLSLDGWQLVSLVWLRSRCVREGRGADAGWAGLIEYRARMLALPQGG